jgi:hypothetical protein
MRRFVLLACLTVVVLMSGYMVAGAYWWKWFPKIDRDHGRPGAGFTPQNKPAEQVLKTWYSL